MTKKTRFIAIIMTFLYLLFTTTTHAGIYRWVDSDGQVNYSDSPAAASAKKIKIDNYKPSPPNTDKNIDSKSDDEITAEETEKPPSTTPPVPKVPEISKNDKRKYCNEAKNDIASISSRGRMREINTKGEYIYLSESQRQNRLATAKKKQREFCR
ncbi:MAG: DUF4124 domain-containing protein [Gammaproteobacteria bacterium]|nr:DUF4124 domain-containing protein [Gammaproteobacteria bacterium]